MVTPETIHLHKQSRILEVVLAGNTYHLPAEYLRISSPSAEVRGHGQAQLVYGKIDVGITTLKSTGNYGLTLIFDDGHCSGIYSWPYLTELCQQQTQRWQHYLTQLQQAGKSRDPHITPLHFPPP